MTIDIFFTYLQYISVVCDMNPLEGLVLSESLD